MREASGLPGDEGRIDPAADAIRGMTKEMVQEPPARRVRLPRSCARLSLQRGHRPNIGHGPPKNCQFIASTSMVLIGGEFVIFVSVVSAPIPRNILR